MRGKLKKINDQVGSNTISNRFEFVNCQLVNGKYLTTFGSLIIKNKYDGNYTTK